MAFLLVYCVVLLLVNLTCEVVQAETSFLDNDNSKEKLRITEAIEYLNLNLSPDNVNGFLSSSPMKHRFLEATTNPEERIQHLKSLPKHQTPDGANFFEDSFTEAVKSLPNCSSLKPIVDVPQKDPISWLPRDGFFLLALCIKGKISERESCIRKYTAMASLLKRKLILPPRMKGKKSKTFTDPEWVVDLAVAQKCFRSRNVLSFYEFFNSTGGMALEVTVACWNQQACLQYSFCEDSHFLFPGIFRTGDCLEKEPLSDFPLLATFNSKFLEQALHNEPIITLGDISHVTGIQGYPGLFEGSINAPFLVQTGKECSLALRPSQAITNTAWKFVKRMIGADFVAIHVQQKDLIGPCVASPDTCPLHIGRLVSCIYQRMQVKGATESPAVFLATDASQQEILLFKFYMETIAGRRFHFTTLLPMENSIWADEFQELRSEPQAVAILEQSICATAPLFVSYIKSAFTSGIMRMRVALKTNTCADYDTCGTF